MSIHTDTGPFALIPEWVLDADIGAQAIRLYAVLGRYADKEGKAYPSRQALAERMRVKSTRTVDAALDELQAIGAVEVEHRFHEEGGKTSNSYLIRRVPRCASDEQRAAHPMSSGLLMKERDPVERDSEGTTVPSREVANLRPRDPLWDALAAEVGEPTTKSERGRLNRALSELREIGATAEQIRARCAAYRSRWSVDLTATALAANWTLLEREPPPRRNGRGVDLDVLFAEINAELRAEAAP